MEDLSEPNNCFLNFVSYKRNKLAKLSHGATEKGYLIMHLQFDVINPFCYFSQARLDPVVIGPNKHLFKPFLQCSVRKNYLAVLKVFCEGSQLRECIIPPGAHIVCLVCIENKKCKICLFVYSQGMLVQISVAVAHLLI